MPSTFNVRMDRFYHLPHNAVVVDEFNFLVSKLDPAQKHYKAKDLQRLFLIEQVRANKFRTFHSKPSRNFTEQDPPDKEKLRAKFFALEDAPICPRHTIPEVYEKIQELGPEDALDWFLQNRRDSFARFASDPERYYDEFVMTPYTTQKQWKYNWAEFVRDYIQFLSYIGIIPAYYKGWGRENEMSGEAGFVISRLGEKYINHEISLPSMLMGYKYRNALVNLDSYPQYARKVRPFFIALLLLSRFKDEGVSHIERNLLSGFVSCIMDETEVEEIVRRYKRRLRDDSKNNLLSMFEVEPVFSKEISRFALTLSKFLIETNLIESNRQGQFNYLSIADLGKQTLANEPKKIAVSNDVIGKLGLTPIIGYILKHFADSVRAGNQEISVPKLYGSSELLKSLLDAPAFKQLLTDISEFSDSPIERIEGDIVNLRGLQYQYSINSSADFSDIYDSNFVEGVPIMPHRQEVVRVERSAALDDIVRRLTDAAVASDGENYENELYNAITNLIGSDYVFRLGNTGARAQRLSDTVWKVPILFDDQQKKLLVVFESKAGNAISSFDERKEKDDLKRTIKHFANELTDIAGIWYVVVDGRRLPENHHGGFRGGQNSLSFEEKLQDIQQTVLSVVNKPVLVSAMNVYSFVEYYKYLYQITRQFGQTFTAFNDTVVQNFWIWGTLFHPIRSYSKIYNDEMLVKNTLRTTYAE